MHKRHSFIQNNYLTLLKNRESVINFAEIQEILSNKKLNFLFEIEDVLNLTHPSIFKKTNTLYVIENEIKDINFDIYNKIENYSIFYDKKYGSLYKPTKEEYEACIQKIATTHKLNLPDYKKEKILSILEKINIISIKNLILHILITNNTTQINNYIYKQKDKDINYFSQAFTMIDKNNNQAKTFIDTFFNNILSKNDSYIFNAKIRIKNIQDSYKCSN